MFAKFLTQGGIPAIENPDTSQKEKLETWLKDCNVFDQSLEEVLRQFHFDVNSLDDQVPGTWIVFISFPFAPYVIMLINMNNKKIVSVSG